MPESKQKLELGENHRRVVSAVLRRVESTCDEILLWLESPGGDLRQLRNDISLKHANELRGLVDHLKEETKRIEDEMVVNVSVQSRARGIAASVSLTRIEIEEILTPGLRGYGPLPPEAEAALDAKLAGLLACLVKMARIADHAESQGAA